MAIMRIRILIPPILLFCTASVIFFAGCKKKRAFKEETGQVTVDNMTTQCENDEAVKDINIVILEQYLLRGKSASPQAMMISTTSVCGVKLDTTGRPGGIITLNYTGADCYGRSRTGSIKVTLTAYPLKKWKNAGCVIRVDFIGYKVTRTSDGRSVQLDGTEYMSNESGGTWFDLWFLGQPSLVYTLTGENIKATFNGGSNMLYNINRKATYTYSGDITTCKVEGMGSSDGRSGLGSWGQDREGAKFTAQITQPVIWKTQCGAMAPLAGEVVIKVEGKDFDMKCKLGTDKDGTPLGVDAASCPYGYEMSWSYKKRTNTRIFSYY
jgi:hypothetical protein